MYTRHMNPAAFHLLHDMETSTGLGLGGGGSYSTTRVRTPFSHLAVIAATLAFPGNLNFLSSFWTAFLPSLIYLHPSSSPSLRFLCPLLRITRVLSSSTVTWIAKSNLFTHRCINQNAGHTFVLVNGLVSSRKHELLNGLWEIQLVVHRFERTRIRSSDHFSPKIQNPQSTIWEKIKRKFTLATH